jgi:hypothetical protein
MRPPRQRRRYGLACSERGPRCAQAEWRVSGSIARQTLVPSIRHHREHIPGRARLAVYVFPGAEGRSTVAFWVRRMLPPGTPAVLEVGGERVVLDRGGGGPVKLAQDSAASLALLERTAEVEPHAVVTVTAPTGPGEAAAERFSLRGFRGARDAARRECTQPMKGADSLVIDCHRRRPCALRDRMERARGTQRGTWSANLLRGRTTTRFPIMAELRTIAGPCRATAGRRAPRGIAGCLAIGLRPRTCLRRWRRSRSPGW